MLKKIANCGRIAAKVVIQGKSIHRITPTNTKITKRSQLLGPLLTFAAILKADPATLHHGSKIQRIFAIKFAFH
jgi:hypothetical protein